MYALKIGQLRQRQNGVEQQHLDFERWSLERVVEMTADYWRQKEEAKFEDAFAKLE